MGHDVELSVDFKIAACRCGWGGKRYPTAYMDNIVSVKAAGCMVERLLTIEICVKTENATFVILKTIISGFDSQKIYFINRDLQKEAEDRACGIFEGIWHEECDKLCKELGFDLEDVYQQKLPPLEQTWEEEFQQLAIELELVLV